MDKSNENIIYEWQFWGLKEKKIITVVSILFYIFVGYLSYLFMEFSYFWGVFAFFLLFFANIKFYLPIKYKLYDSFIEIIFLNTSNKKNWNYFKRYIFENNGLFLSPFINKSYLDNFRGIYLIFSKDTDVEMLKKLVSEKIKSE